MLRDVTPFARVWDMRADKRIREGVKRFVRFVEQKLGGTLVYETADLPLERADLVEAGDLIDTLMRAGIIESVRAVDRAPDEPPLFQWAGIIRSRDSHRTGGVSTASDRDALLPLIAESLERYIWYDEDDYFTFKKYATAREAAKIFPVVAPSSFAGFSSAQRESSPALRIHDDSRFTWIAAYSWTSKRRTYVPAKIVSGKISAFHDEPLIRPTITTGLATWPSSREEAVLRGAYEIIERDAFMIMWLNQLSLPRADIDELARMDPALARLLASCARYRLRPSVVQLITDAPCYAVCGFVEDESGMKPRITVGMGAHRSLARAAEHAILEALRARLGARAAAKNPPIDTKGEQLRHYERLAYWVQGDRDRALDFIAKGPLVKPEPHEWDHDSATAHLDRLVAWCRDRGYELCSVDMGASEKNVLGWHIEMTIIPQLQPMHQMERLPCIGGARLRDIPSRFGYTARAHPFTKEPQPFA